MPKVLNKRTDKIPSDAIYVGRPSRWGNPYRIGQKVNGLPINREEAIGFYESWISNQVAAGLLGMEELRGKDLVCWCAPLPCHADILLELANREVSNERSR